jgi:hypothetical protein
VIHYCYAEDVYCILVANLVSVSWNNAINGEALIVPSGATILFPKADTIESFHTMAAAGIDLSQVPAMALPAGQISNFEDSYNRGPAYIVVAAISWVLPHFL